MKICYVCNIVKDESDFYLKNKNKGIRSNKCKTCQLEYTKAHYVANKQKYINRARRDSNKNRDKIKLLIKDLKIKCVDCGESHPAVLDFHHLDPTQKEYQVARLTSKRKILFETAKCVVLCSNCHRIRHWEEKQPMPL